MAERRMFAKTIIDSDAFLDMPLSSQALYFHLSMRADDDGFLNNAKKIQRTIGSADDDLKILFAKNFIIPFESGVCVIKHWMIHNMIQKDRYKPTMYGEEKEKLSIKNNKSYTMLTECIHDGNSPLPQVRLGKSSLGEVSKPLVEIVDDYFDDFWYKYPKKVGKEAARKAWNKYNPEIIKVIDALNWQIQSKQWNKNDGEFIPNPATYLNQGRWMDEAPTEQAPF
jgi:hypothetical protein